MYLKHFSVQQLPQDCESSFKLDRIKTMEQSNSLDINIKLELQTIHRFLQTRRRPLLGPYPD